MSWTQPFLQRLAATGVLARAARECGVKPVIVYQRKAKDADFAAAIEEAMEEAVDQMEQEARRRALDGVDEPIVYQGSLTPEWQRDENGERVMEAYEVTDAKGVTTTHHRPVQLVVDGRPQWVTVKKHSDALLMFLLKGRRKKVFSDKTEIDISNPDGSMTAVDPATRAARIASLLALAEQRKADDYGDIA